MKQIAIHDALTGLFNRRYFLENALIQMERSARTGRECFIVIFDLDHFKTVNDRYGHLAGDKVLVEIVQRVKKSVRPYDLFGRYGGEEFIILMPDISEIDVINATERIRQDMSKTPVKFEDVAITITASFGIAHATPADDLNVATRYADDALYQAKNNGRNNVVFYENNRVGSDPE